MAIKWIRDREFVKKRVGDCKPGSSWVFLDTEGAEHPGIVVCPHDERSMHALDGAVCWRNAKAVIPMRPVEFQLTEI